MQIRPCNNCKKKETCNVFKLLERKGRILNPWKLDEKIREISVHTELVSADLKSDEIVLECTIREPAVQEESYEQLVNGKIKKCESELCDCDPSTCKKCCH